MAATILKPPTQPTDSDWARPSIFLAGSIAMDTAERWQDALSAQLADLDVLLLNPRRDDWDTSWEATWDNPVFRQQVEWELEGLERATWIAMYFSPPTQAPITLLELGLMAHSGRLIVCCPEGFWRKGNVDIVCRRHNIPQVPNLEVLGQTLRARLEALHSGS
ncbi:MAG: nucleoside 2-deoxyribosyltransferase domain-containing protein [Myxococcota bacterium]